MGLKDWINKLKPSENSKSGLADRAKSAASSFGARFAKVRAQLSERFPKERVSQSLAPVEKALGPIRGAFGRGWNAIKNAGLKNETIRNTATKFGTAWATIREKLPRNAEDMKNFRPQELMDSMSGVFGQSKNIATYLRLFAVAIAAYFLADTAALFTDSFIPDPPPVPVPVVRPKLERRSSVDEYADITRRNIFSSKNIIPDDTMVADPNGPARKTNLPLNLVGTVVLQNELKSIAAIEDKGSNQTVAVRVNETIEGKATIKKIEQMKVTFINIQNGMLEYVEIPQDAPSNVSVRPSAVSKPGGGAGIEKSGETHFNVSKSEIDKALGNLNEILTQARAIPNFENGQPNGYKIIQIVPGSIYTKLGINEGDVLQAVNGDPITDPGKAFQLMNELKSGSGHIEITVKSPDGKVRNQSYDVSR